MTDTPEEVNLSDALVNLKPGDKLTWVRDGHTTVSTVTNVETDEDGVTIVDMTPQWEPET